MTMNLMTEPQKSFTITSANSTGHNEQLLYKAGEYTKGHEYQEMVITRGHLGGWLPYPPIKWKTEEGK